MGGQPPSLAGREAAGAYVSLMSCRIHRIRLAAASGWSPNSWAIRLTQPAMPNCRTVRLITSPSASGVGASDRCSPGREQGLTPCVVHVQPGHDEPPRLAC